MAKVSGPLFSESASGNMASGNMQYRSGHWGTHVYKPLSPGQQNQGKPSAAQAEKRKQFLTIRDNWHLLTPDAKQDYQAQAAKIGNINGWNLFVSEGMTSMRPTHDSLLTFDGLTILTDSGGIIKVD